ncbi:MAG: hypothetical protein AB7U75_00280 [Hyphomicrobiaceae bacterium]
MANNNPKLLLHRINGETLEVRADEILSVEKQSAIGGARIMLTRTDAEGLSVHVAVRETAEAIVRQLSGAPSAH